MSDAEHPSFLASPERPVFLHALRITTGRAALWLLIGAFTLLLALAVSSPWLEWFRQALDHRYAPGSLLRGLDEVFRFDSRFGRGALEQGTRTSGAVLALLAMLGGVFTAGGWLQVFLERTNGHSLRRFFYGGSRYFFRFLRVLVLTLLTLHLVGWVLYGKPWNWLVHGVIFDVRAGDLQSLDSELTVRRIGWVQDGLHFLFVGLVLVWGTYTRTRLALHDTSSALWAGICSWVLLFLHPIRTLVPMLFLFLSQAGLLWVGGYFTGNLQAGLGPESDWLPVAILFLITVLAILWRTIVRGASYHAALQVSAGLVRPLARPDPWKESVGGPGGPRYPIGGDEYGVSI